MKIFNLFLNYSCNARCGFCFNPAEPRKEEWRGMSTQKALAMLMDARQAGCDAVSFIGGEATLRTDFVKIVAAARRLGFSELRLVTNAIKLAERAYAEQLVAAGLSRVEISLHAPDAATHDALLKTPGAFDKAVTAIGHLQELGARVGINVVVTKLNYRLLPRLAEAFVRRGVRDFSFFSQRYIGHLGLAPNIAELKVSQSETAPYVRQALEVLRREGCLKTTCLGDFTPCVLPGYEDLMTDWSAGANLDRVGHPDGRSEDSEPVCSDGKRLIAACAACVFKERCLGVNEPYLALFGEAEFKPLAAAGAAS